MVVRRCPTLPHPPGCSTIGAVGLSFRVRDGTGRFPHAMTAVTLCPRPWGPGEGCPGVGNLVVTTCPLPPVVGRWWCCYSVLVPSSNVPVAGLLFGNHIVDASSLVSLYSSAGVNVF